MNAPTLDYVIDRSLAALDRRSAQPLEPSRLESFGVEAHRYDFFKLDPRDTKTLEQKQREAIAAHVREDSTNLNLYTEAMCSTAVCRKVHELLISGNKQALGDYLYTIFVNELGESIQQEADAT